MSRPAHTISSTVPPQFVSWNVIDYLATRFNYLPAEKWRAWVAAGKVQRNNVVCEVETIVTAGDMIICELPDWEQPDANLDYQIIFEDAWMLGVNKPSNLRVHSGGRFLKMNLMYQLKYEHHPAYPEAELINRLDADTSGVVLVGKAPEVVKAMGELFLHKQVEKEYVGVVVGVPAEAEGVINLPVGKVPNTRVRFGTGAGIKNPKEALTRYEVLERFGDGYALLKLKPLTGRTHQLRVHLAAVGHPLVGDKLYRSSSEEQFVRWCNHPEEAADAELIGRHALHCTATAFDHPFTAQPTWVEAPLAADMVALLEKLR